MLSQKMQDALNAQINAELLASYKYLAMAAYFESENLPGCAKWMHIQSDEERAHAMKFYAYINSRRGRVLLHPLEGPKNEWSGALEVFEAALKHEQMVTGMISSLMELAISERDYATQSFLNWFVDEQVEEEANVDAVIQDLKRIGDSAQGLFILDRELGQRQVEADEGDAEGEE